METTHATAFRRLTRRSARPLSGDTVTISLAAFWQPSATSCLSQATGFGVHTNLAHPAESHMMSLREVKSRSPRCHQCGCLYDLVDVQDPADRRELERQRKRAREGPLREHYSQLEGAIPKTVCLFNRSCLPCTDSGYQCQPADEERRTRGFWYGLDRGSRQIHR